MTAEEYVDLPWTWQYEEDPEALACLIEGYLEDGDPIPLPPGVTPAASR